MACTKVAYKAMDTMTTWKTMFPDFTTMTGSTLFIKKLIAVSLSAITYFRGIFPEHAYGERQLSGLKVKILSECNENEGVQKFINLIRSCYDAVEKKYLLQLSIGVCIDPEKQDEVIESYSMNFRYRDDDCTITCNNKKSPSLLKENNPTVTATLWLLKSIIMMSDILKPLPQKAYLTIKLLYNDEITPNDYEPAGFEPSDCEKFKHSPDAMKIKIGSEVLTGMHGYKMYLKTSLSKEPLTQYMEESVMDSTQTSKDFKDSQMYNSGGLFSKKNIGSQKIIDDESDAINCPCKCPQDFGTEIVCCIICKKRQHAICYGILDCEKIDSTFCCTQCISDAPFSDMQLDLIYTYDDNEQQKLCICRRAFVICHLLKNVTITQLQKHLGCNKLSAKDLIEKFESEGFLKTGKVKGRYVINNKVINAGYHKYFPMCKNQENIKLPKVQTPNLTTSEKRRSSKRTKLHDIIENDNSDELFQSQPKRRCLRKKEILPLSE